MNTPPVNPGNMHLFQTSFGIPAEGVYTGLVVLLIAFVAVLLVVIYVLSKRNVQLVEDNREITKDAIKGFQDVINALNLIREQLQQGDNALMGKINDSEKKIHERLIETQREIVSHLQYLRDRSR